jgi:hypothetical protein
MTEPGCPTTRNESAAMKLSKHCTLYSDWWHCRRRRVSGPHAGYILRHYGSLASVTSAIPATERYKPAQWCSRSRRCFRAASDGMTGAHCSPPWSAKEPRVASE